MTRKAFTLLCLLMALGLSSCTVQDRLYMPGKNIEWKLISRHHKKHITTKAVSDSLYSDIINTDTAEDYNNLIASSQNSFSPLKITDKTGTGSLNLNNKKSPVSNQENIKGTQIKHNHKINNPLVFYKKGNIKEGTPVHWAAIASFTLGILGLVSIVGAVLSPLTIILSLIALKKIKNNPDKYEGRSLALAGLIIGIIDFVLIIAAILILRFSFM